MTLYIVAPETIELELQEADTTVDNATSTTATTNGTTNGTTNETTSSNSTEDSTLIDYEGVGSSAEFADY